MNKVRIRFIAFILLLLPQSFLSAAENIAREKGYKRIGIHTTEDNIIARALYLSAGYTVTEIGSCTTADGKERVGYTFQKEI